MDFLPTEILQKIFCYLPANDLIQCFYVCNRWNSIIKTYSEEFWKLQCGREFNDIYKESYRRANLSWRELYFTLSSWPYIEDADVEVTHANVGFLNSFNLLKNCIISFATSSTDATFASNYDIIVHYNLETKQVKRSTKTPNVFKSYYEDDKFLIYKMSCANPLIVIPKQNPSNYIIRSLNYEMWFVKNDDIFYTAETNHHITLYHAKLVSRGSRIEFEETVLIESLNGDLIDVCIKNGEIYLLLSNCMDSRLKCISRVVQGNNEHVYHFDRRHTSFRDVKPILESCGFCWSNNRVFEAIIRNFYNNKVFRKYRVIAAITYGNYVITGSKEPLVINIFYDPYDSNGNLMLHKKAPVKTINLEEYKIDEWMDIGKYTGLIRMFDVVETRNGHKLIVVFCMRLFVIELKNTIK